MDAIEFLNSHLCSEAEATHVWDQPGRSKKFYNFLPNGLTAFWMIYCQWLKADNHAVPYMFEIPTDSHGFIVDLKLLFPHDPRGVVGTEQFFENRFLEEAVKVLQGYVERSFILQMINDVHESVTVMYSEPWEEKTGGDSVVNAVYVRFQFINLRVDAKAFAQQCLPEIAAELDRSNVIQYLQVPMLSSFAKSVMPRKADTPFLLYGSKSASCLLPLSEFQLWTSTGEGVKEEEIESFFAPQVHRHAREGNVDADALEEAALENDFADLLMPFFLSIEYAASSLAKRRKERPQTRIDVPFKFHEESEIDLCLRFVKMLLPERFLMRETNWLDIGKAFHNCTQGGEIGVQSWIAMTKEVLERGETDIPYFMTDNVEITCRKHYDTFERSGVTLKTIAWYAAKDSPTDYNRWHRAWIDEAVIAAIDGGGTQSDIAEVFYRRYWLHYLYDPTNARGTWYRFKMHRWNEIKGAMKGLRDVISRSFANNFEQLRANVVKEISMCHDDEEKFRMEKKEKLVGNIIRQLKTSSFKNGLIQEMAAFFADDEFNKRRDEMYYLTGVQNGVLEVVDDRIFFREGKPEDYITMSTGIPYREEYGRNTPVVKEAMSWFEMTFTDPEIRDYYLKFMASGFIGRNTHKKFFVMTGDGDNGKGMMVRGAEEVWGDYCFKLPVDALSVKYSNPGAPSPHLARARATRFAFTEEPEKTVNLAAGVIKRLTGNDKLFSRRLNENGGDSVMSFTMGMSTNDIPMIPNPDAATHNRVCIIPFTSKWIHDAPPSFEEQMKLRRFPYVPGFEARIPLMAAALLWIFVKHFPRFAADFSTPQAIRDSCEEYWLTKDLYAVYLRERVNRTIQAAENEKEITLRFRDLYIDFKIWFRENYSGIRTPDSGTARSNFTKHLGRLLGGGQTGSGWIGPRLLEEAPLDTPLREGMPRLVTV